MRLPAKKRDRVGYRLENTEVCQNGYIKTPIGHLWTIERETAGRLHLIGDPCSCCGVQTRITIMNVVANRRPVGFLVLPLWN